MYIAICLSGQLRKLSECDFPKIFCEQNTKYYIHTWEHEANPNLQYLEEFLGDESIVVETEKYEDVFDTLKYPQSNVSVHRYRFAQFYSIMKSFQMAQADTFRKDLVLRCRTDVALQPYTWKESNFQEHWDNFKKIVKDHHAHGNFDYTHIDTVDCFTYPWIASKVLSIDYNYASFQDWFWVMNSSALNTLTRMSPEAAVKKAMEIKEKHDPRFGNYEDRQVESDTLKSPGAWANIFQENRIPLINHEIGDSTLRRTPGYVPQDNYGDRA